MRMITEEKAKITDIGKIYIEPVVRTFERGQQILSNYPNAEIVEVPSHWKIPELHGNEGSINDWIKIKKNILVLGVKKSLTCRPNERSSHFVAPSISNGCAMACSYCYVPRRKGFANPITLFVNIDQILNYIRRHAGKQGPMTSPGQIDEKYWVYDIGENGDCSVDALIADNSKIQLPFSARCQMLKQHLRLNTSITIYSNTTPNGKHVSDLVCFLPISRKLSIYERRP